METPLNNETPPINQEQNIVGVSEVPGKKKKYIRHIIIPSIIIFLVSRWYIIFMNSDMGYHGRRGEIIVSFVIIATIIISYVNYDKGISFKKWFLKSCFFSAFVSMVPILIYGVIIGSSDSILFEIVGSLLYMVIFLPIIIPVVYGTCRTVQQHKK